MLPEIDSVFGPIRQIAFVVADIDEAIESWHKQMGIGPFAIVRNCKPLKGSRYRGEASDEIVINMAFAYIGDVQLELIEQVNETPSMYQESVERGYWGAHHYAVCVEDFDAAYQHSMNNGFTAVMNAGAPGYAQMAYVESEHIPGLMLEIIEWNDLTRPYFDGIAAFLATADPGTLKHNYKL
jgi:hypothetical protein